MVTWLAFIACTAIILFAGANLSKYGDIIAEKTGLGRTWIGIVLLASVTSLPELMTGISSVAIFDVPDIAVGDVFGSCMFNLVIIALLDPIGGPSPISAQAHQGQVLGASFGILLLGLAIMSIVGPLEILSVGWVGAYSFLAIGIYLTAMRAIFSYEKKRIAEFVKDVVQEFHYKDISQSKAITMYSANALLTITAASLLPYLGNEIAEVTGLGQTFVGNILIALSTSLPEVVVSIAAVKIGAVDLAFGNVLGSNLFNLNILALDDIFYTKGPILRHISEGHVVSGIAAVMMTALIIVGLTYRASKKRLFLAWDTLGILMVYLLAISGLYIKR